MRILAPIIALFVVTATAVAQQPKATVELVSEVASITPGQPFTVAIRFKIQPGWHLYWLNPGDTGAPPKVKWTLPPGYQASPLQFPVPSRIGLPENLTAFGYQDELVLLTTITPPADAKAVDPIKLQARVTWVICKEVCIAERQEVELSLPAKATAPDRSADFKAWRALQPIRPDPRPVDITVERSPADPSIGSLTYPLKTGETGVDFFPPTADFLTYDKPTTRRVSGGASFVVGFKILPGPHERLTAPAVVVIESQGNRTAIEVPCTIDFSN